MYDISQNIYIPITKDSVSQSSPFINGNKITWYDNRYGIFNIYMCDLTGNTGNIVSWCSTFAPQGGLRQITNKNKNSINLAIPPKN